MTRGALSNLHPFLKLLITLGISVLAVFIIFIIGLLLAVIFFGVDIQEFAFDLQDISSPGTIVLLKYLQIIQTIFLFIVPAIFLSVFFFKDGVQGFGLNLTLFYTTFFVVVFLVYFSFPLINLLAEWNAGMKLPAFLSGLEEKIRSMEDEAARLTEAFLKVDSLGGLMVNMFMIAFLPAIGEELFFRGLIQNQLLEWTRRPWLAILLASAFFSFIHLQFYGFLPRLYLGIIFGLIYYWSGSIWYPILAHFLNNGTAVVIYYVFGSQVVESEFDTLGATGETWYLVFLSALLVGTSLYFLARKSASSGSLFGKSTESWFIR